MGDVFTGSRKQIYRDQAATAARVIESDAVELRRWYLSAFCISAASETQSAVVAEWARPRGGWCRDGTPGAAHMAPVCGCAVRILCVTSTQQPRGLIPVFTNDTLRSVQRYCYYTMVGDGTPPPLPPVTQTKSVKSRTSVCGGCRLVTDVIDIEFIVVRSFRLPPDVVPASPCVAQRPASSVI